MAHPSLPSALLRASLATCAVAWLAAACSSNASTEKSAAGDDGGPLTTQSDSGSADSAPGNNSVDSAAADSQGTGDASDPGHDGGGTPAPLACHAGDRKEWSGAVASTGVAVAVCSACGASYVVASNGTAAAGQVTIDNGSMTVTLAVPAAGTATSAYVTDNPADGTVTVCATGASHGCLPMALQNQRYCNPYRDLVSLVPERIDQGVDFGGAGPIYAMGPGTIDLYRNRTDTGWPGGTFVSYALTVGPAAGKEIYLAENIDLNPSLQSGSFVYSGTVLGTLVDASPDSESGWGVAGEGITAEYGCYTEGCMTPLGVNFNALLVVCRPRPESWGKGAAVRSRAAGRRTGARRWARGSRRRRPLAGNMHRIPTRRECTRAQPPGAVALSAPDLSSLAKWRRSCKREWLRPSRSGWLPLRRRSW
jgi:hypothetical protein